MQNIIAIETEVAFRRAELERMVTAATQPCRFAGAIAFIGAGIFRTRRAVTSGEASRTLTARSIDASFRHEHRLS